MSQPFVGEIRTFGFSFAPRNWALCNGSLLPIAQNTQLYSVIGTTYGGNGVTTFALPDLRNRLPMHQGTGSGLTPVVVGEQKGSSQITLSLSNLPSHNHPLKAIGTAPTAHGPASAALATMPRSGPPLYAATTANTTMVAGTGGSNGSGIPVDMVQPITAVNFAIALVGIDPYAV